MNYKSQVTRKETDLVKGGMSGNSLPDLNSKCIPPAKLVEHFFISSPSVRASPSRPVRQNPTIILNYTVRQNPVLSLYNAIKSNLNPLVKFKIISSKVCVKGVSVILDLVLIHLFNGPKSIRFLVSPYSN